MNVSTEQFEFLLSLMGTLVDQQVKQANALARLSKAQYLGLDEQVKQAKALERIAAAIEWQVDANREQAGSAWVKVR